MRRSVELSGGTFRYLEAGDVDLPLVLCLHGFPDHPGTFEGIMGSLAEAGYRAIAPWMRGYSPSVTDGPYHISRLSADVVELIDALAGDAKVAIVSHDWGAIATYAAAAELKDRLACAVTMSVPHPLALLANMRGAPGQLLRSSYIGLFQFRGVADRLVWSHDFEYIDKLWRRWSPGFDIPAAHRARLKSCLAASMPAPLGYYRDLLSLSTLRSAKRVGTLSQPFLYLHGARDGCIDVEMSRNQDRYFRHLHSKTIDDVGHFLHLEARHSVANSILGWVREHLAR